jgi:hypothetical protein
VSLADDAPKRNRLAAAELELILAVNTSPISTVDLAKWDVCVNGKCKHCGAACECVNGKCSPLCDCLSLPVAEVLPINPGSADAKPLVAEVKPTVSAFATNAVHVVGGTTFTFHGTWQQSSIDAHLAGRTVSVTVPTYTAASFGGCSGGSCGAQQYRPLTSFGGYSGGSRCGPWGCR